LQRLDDITEMWKVMISLLGHPPPRPISPVFSENKG
jgi:hypothetical protein